MRCAARSRSRRELGLGLYRERPGRTLRLFGLAPVDRDRGLILVYSAALAGWSYLTAWGALHAAHVERARPIGGVLGVGVGLLLLAELTRIHEPAATPTAVPSPTVVAIDR